MRASVMIRSSGVQLVGSCVFITEILSSVLLILSSFTDTLRAVAEIMSDGAEILTCASETFVSVANDIESWC